jgi:hypothetical protein
MLNKHNRKRINFISKRKTTRLFRADLNTEQPFCPSYQLLITQSHIVIYWLPNESIGFGKKSASPPWNHSRIRKVSSSYECIPF